MGERGGPAREGTRPHAAGDVGARMHAGRPPAVGGGKVRVGRAPLGERVPSINIY
jgi:hypothetical protein